MTEQLSPNFDSIRQVNEQGTEYWSARDLAKLLGYSQWRRFEDAVKRAILVCRQIGQNVQDHIADAGKMIATGKGANRQVKDYWLSRFGSYLVAQNGDPRKPEIAAAQAYFATATRENELAYQQLEEQNQRVAMRRNLDENNQDLERAAYEARCAIAEFWPFSPRRL